MKNDNPTHETKTGKVIPLGSKSKHVPAQHGDNSLLKSLGYETLIGMVTPEELEEAELLLKEYMENFFSPVDKKIMLAYIFGVWQGMNDIYKDRAGKALADKLTGIHRMGKRMGFIEAYRVFKTEEFKQSLSSGNKE